MATTDSFALAPSVKTETLGEYTAQGRDVILLRDIAL